MASILKKLRVVTSSNAHKVLDFLIDLDDVGALKVYARDLQGAIDQLSEYGNGLIGAVAALERDEEAFTELLSETDADITALLSDDDESNDHHALGLQVTYNDTEKRLKGVKKKLKKKREDSQQTEEYITAMEAKLKSMVLRIEELEEADEEAEAMEDGAEALSDSMDALGDTPDVDSVGRKIIEKREAARAKLDRAMGHASDAKVNDKTISRAEAALAARRAKLNSTEE